jgi:hypothetical protein
MRSIQMREVVDGGTRRILAASLIAALVGCGGEEGDDGSVLGVDDALGLGDACRNACRCIDGVEGQDLDDCADECLAEADGYDIPSACISCVARADCGVFVCDGGGDCRIAGECEYACPVGQETEPPNEEYGNDCSGCHDACQHDYDACGEVCVDWQRDCNDSCIDAQIRCNDQCGGSLDCLNDCYEEAGECGDLCFGQAWDCLEGCDRDFDFCDAGCC